MNKLLPRRSKRRLIFFLIVIFLGISNLLLLAQSFYPILLIPLLGGLTSVIIIYFIYRWRITVESFTNFTKEFEEIKSLILLAPLFRNSFLPYDLVWALEPGVILRILNCSPGLNSGE